MTRAAINIVYGDLVYGKNKNMKTLNESENNNVSELLTFTSMHKR